MNESSVTETVIGHTPGPWKYEPLSAAAHADPDLEAREDDLFWIFNTAVVEPVVEHVLATVHRYPVEQAEANARLIAAAPDLLEACKFFLSVLDINRAATAESPVDRIRAAVARAEGRS